MPVTKISCDVCGGPIQVMKGGQRGICPYCKTEYLIERLREMASGSRISVTGSDNDIAQWKSMLDIYMENCDYTAAENTVRKILEGNPTDTVSMEIYKILQGAKFMEIQDGVLMKYNGMSENVTVPKALRQSTIPPFFAAKQSAALICLTALPASVIMHSVAVRLWSIFQFPTLLRKSASLPFGNAII